MASLLDLLRGARVFDLGQPYFPGMPHYPTHPPFLYSLSKLHGDSMRPGGVSSSADAIALGTHNGTHMDALCHYSKHGRLHGGQEVRQSYSGGIEALSIDTVPPVLRRGILLDIAGFRGVDALDEDVEITPQEMADAATREGVEAAAGDVVLLRTGWARFWDDPPRYIRDVRGPGPGEAGARWLSERGVYAAGSDTVSFEKVPSEGMPVHAHLLVESGIHIFEALNVEELARERVYEFAFAALPLKIRGATGSPVRPAAITFSL